MQRWLSSAWVSHLRLRRLRLAALTVTRRFAVTVAAALTVTPAGAFIAILVMPSHPCVAMVTLADAVAALMDSLRSVVPIMGVMVTRCTIAPTTGPMDTPRTVVPIMGVMVTRCTVALTTGLMDTQRTIAPTTGLMVTQRLPQGIGFIDRFTLSQGTCPATESIDPLLMGRTGVDVRCAPRA